MGKFSQPRNQFRDSSPQEPKSVPIPEETSQEPVILPVPEEAFREPVEVSAPEEAFESPAPQPEADGLFNSANSSLTIIKCGIGSSTIPSRYIF